MFTAPVVVALFKSAGTKTDSEDRYLNILETNNFRGISVPTLSFEFQLEELRQCLLQPEKYSGFILTSQRSVESIKEAVETLPDAWKERRHYCVGVQTCETAVKLLGLTNIAGQDCGNATNLSALIVEEYQTGSLPMLFPCSSLKMDTLPRVLEDHKIPVAIVNSYRTIPHPHLREFVMDLNSDKPDCVVFFSPSGINFALPFLRECDWISETKFVSIGSTTARSMEEAKLPVAGICTKPTPEDLLEVLKSLFSQTPSFV